DDGPAWVDAAFAPDEQAASAAAVMAAANRIFHDRIRFSSSRWVLETKSTSPGAARFDLSCQPAGTDKKWQISRTPRWLTAAVPDAQPLRRTGYVLVAATILAV